MFKKEIETDYVDNSRVTLSNATIVGNWLKGIEHREWNRTHKETHDNLLDSFKDFAFQMCGIVAGAIYHGIKKVYPIF